MEKICKKRHISPGFLCGGTPREKIMGRLNRIEDLDITTGDSSIQNLSREMSIELSKSYTIKTKVMDDGHSSIYMGDFKLDFSSNFNVPEIDKHLLKLGIKKATPLQKEMFSRDFTCNALLLTLDLKNVLDPTGKGLQDIKNKVIRCCLDPEVTLLTNKNRVIRAIYLAAKLNFELDPALMKWIKEHPESIKFSSEKTLAEKLNKALELNANRTTYLLDQMGLWDYVPITKELYPYYIKRITSK